MRSDAAVAASVLGKSAVSFACCLAISLIIYQGQVLNPNFWLSQMVIFALVGSVFLYTLRVNRRNAFAVLLVIYVLQEGLLFRHIRDVILLRDLIFYATLAAAIYIFFKTFDRKITRYRYLHPLVLATIFALAFSAATLILAGLDEVIFHPLRTSLLNAVLTNTRIEFLVGLGIGLGMNLNDYGYTAKTVEFTKNALGGLGATFKKFGERL